VLALKALHVKLESNILQKPEASIAPLSAFNSG
jgi:hypothetical protein